jgi:RNA polymerase sigma-70 factor, ECF subfamily
MLPTMTHSEEKFDALYRDHAPAVLAYCLRRASREAAEEAVAETFTTAWRRLGDAPGSSLPWLLGIARRVLANQRRSTRRQQALSERLAAERPESADPGSTMPVLEALSGLAAGDQEVLMLVAWDGLRSAEAAQVLGCSPVAFRIRVHRARRRLAKALTETRDTADPAAPTDLRLQAKETGS